MIHYNHAAPYTVKGYVDLSKAGRMAPLWSRPLLNGLLSESNMNTLLELDGVLYSETRSFQVFEALLERIHNTGMPFSLQEAAPLFSELSLSVQIGEELALGRSEDLQYSIS